MSTTRGSFVYKGISGKILLKINGSPTFVARVETVDITVERELESFFQCGSFVATEILEGFLRVSGTIKKAVWNTKMLRLLIGAKDPDTFIASLNDSVNTASVTKPYQISDVQLQLVIQDRNLGGSPFKLTVIGTKFGRYRIDMDKDKFIMEDITFIGKNILIESVDETTEPTYPSTLG